MRKSVSLLFEAGHSDAGYYPLGMMYDEARLVVERRNGVQVTAAILLQAAVSSILSKEGGKHFKKLTEDLSH